MPPLLRTLLCLALVVAGASACSPRRPPKLEPPPRPPPITVPVAPLGTTTGEAATRLASATDEAAAADDLRALAAESEPQQLLVQALCSGMEQLDDLDEAVETGDWRGFLLDAMRDFALDLAIELLEADAVAAVDDLLTAWDLGQVSPQAAQLYARACGQV